MYASERLTAIPYSFHVIASPELHHAVDTLAPRLTAATGVARATHDVTPLMTSDCWTLPERPLGGLCTLESGHAVTGRAVGGGVPMSATGRGS